MTSQALQEAAERWMERVWRQRDVGAVDDTHTPDFIDRSPAGRGGDNAAYKAGLAELFEAFPNWYATTADLIVDTEQSKVAVRWTATGTHRGSFMGYPATGRLIRFAGIEIITIRRGRVAERWGEWDGLDLQAQLA